MSETETDPSPAKTPQRKSEALWLIAVLLIAGGIFGAAFFWPLRGNILPLAGSGPSEQMMELERRVHTLEDRANVMEARLNNMPDTPPQKEQGRILSATDLEHMQSDLTQMTTTMGALQDQMKQTGTATHALAQGALAKMVAFMQLRDAALSNRAFAHELDTMRVAAKDDAGLKDPLDKLAPYAGKGAPNIALLREQLAEQSGAVEVASAKAKAQSWWERILAEFRGLVIIRDVNAGAEGNGLAAVKAPLAEDNLAAALDALKNQPAEVQQVLGDWRKQAEARLAIDDALRAIADHLATGGAAPAPAAAPATAPTEAAPDKDTP